MGGCEGMYRLPPYSTMPRGWPEWGWKGEWLGKGAEGKKEDA